MKKVKWISICLILVTISTVLTSNFLDNEIATPACFAIGWLIGGFCTVGYKEDL